jgi:hypothetical protein
VKLIAIERDQQRVKQTWLSLNRALQSFTEHNTTAGIKITHIQYNICDGWRKCVHRTGFELGTASEALNEEKKSRNKKQVE